MIGTPVLITPAWRVGVKKLCSEQPASGKDPTNMFSGLVQVPDPAVALAATPLRIWSAEGASGSNPSRFDQIATYSS